MAVNERLVAILIEETLELEGSVFGPGWKKYNNVEMKQKEVQGWSEDIEGRWFMSGRDKIRLEEAKKKQNKELEQINITLLEGLQRLVMDLRKQLVGAMFVLQKVALMELSAECACDDATRVILPYMAEGVGDGPEKW